MVVIVKKSPDRNVLIDYLSVTFPTTDRELFEKEEQSENYPFLQNEHFKFFIKLLNIKPDEYSDDGKIPFYERMFTYKENIYFKFNGPPDNYERITHSFELKGNGCREAESLGIDWNVLFAYIYANELTVSTLHIAADLFTDKYFKVSDLLRKALNLEVYTSFHSFNYIGGLHLKKGTQTGLSLYFGRRDSNQVNIYDKKNERYYKGYDVDTNTWIRIETRLKSDKSGSFINMLIIKGYDSLAEIYMKVLYKFLDFQTPNRNDTNKDRWPTWKPWSNFLNTTKKTKLVRQYDLESSITKKRKWHKTSVGKSDLEIYASDPDEYLNFKKEIMKEKLDKLDNKSLTRVNKERINKGLKPFKDLYEFKEFVKNYTTI